MSEGPATTDDDDGGAPGLANDLTLSGFLEQVAAARPDPGGGAASAIILATGVGLAEMVAGYSGDVVAADPYVPARLRSMRAQALALVAGDARASAGFARAMAMDAADPGRVDAVVNACVVAAESAMAIAGVAESLLAELDMLDRDGERRVHADVRVAAAAAGAALRASVANVQACLGLAGRTDPGALGRLALQHLGRGLDRLLVVVGRADALAAVVR